MRLLVPITSVAAPKSKYHKSDLLDPLRSVELTLVIIGLGVGSSNAVALISRTSSFIVPASIMSVTTPSSVLESSISLDETSYKV